VIAAYGCGEGRGGLAGDGRTVGLRQDLVHDRIAERHRLGPQQALRHPAVELAERLSVALGERFIEESARTSLNAEARIEREKQSRRGANRSLPGLT
jgi:hypothetical protein